MRTTPAPGRASGATGRCVREAGCCTRVSTPPSDTALWRWLERGVAEGTLCRMGKGRRNSPYRYWLAGREPMRNSLPELDELD